MKKSARRRMYLNTPSATSRELSDAIRVLESFFNWRSATWEHGRYPVPVGIGLKFNEALCNWEVILAEYRHIRAELLQIRNARSRLLHELSLEQSKPKLQCRKRLQPIVRILIRF
jgi:hypothetical protein